MCNVIAHSIAVNGIECPLDLLWPRDPSDPRDLPDSRRPHILHSINSHYILCISGSDIASVCASESVCKSIMSCSPSILLFSLLLFSLLLFSFLSPLNSLNASPPWFSLSFHLTSTSPLVSHPPLHPPCSLPLLFTLLSSPQ